MKTFMSSFSLPNSHEIVTSLENLHEEVEAGEDEIRLVMQLPEKQHQEWEETLLSKQAGSYYSGRLASRHIKGKAELQAHSPIIRALPSSCFLP